MNTVTIAPRGPYSLQASRKFLCGFTPASGSSASQGESLTLSFLLDRTYEPAAVTITQEAEALRCEIHGSENTVAVVAQAARILSLDHDGTKMAEVATRDPVIGGLIAREPGFRPVCFASPYEAAVWGVLAQRVPMAMAARVKRRLAEVHGGRVEANGQRFEVIPSPEKMLGIEAFAGLADERIARLHAVAQAALDGTLDAEKLRAMPEDFALAKLKSLRGVGEWTAQHILMRGTGIADALPTAEPRVLRAFGIVYGLGRDATVAEFARASERWKPLRMWVCVRLVSDLAGRPEWSAHRDDRNARSASRSGAVRSSPKA